MGYVQMLTLAKHQIQHRHHDKRLNEHDYSLLNILGIVRTVKKGWVKLQTTFGGFGFRL